MLDVHFAVATDVHLAAADINTAEASGLDGDSTPLQPQYPNGTLRYIGVDDVANDISAMTFFDTDLVVDPNTGLVFTRAGTPGLQMYRVGLKYQGGKRRINVQTTAAHNVIAATIDDFPFKPKMVCPLDQNALDALPDYINTVTYGGALVAQTLKGNVWSPSNMPAGIYAILGYETPSLTTRAWLRLQHADFKGFFPGGIALDPATAPDVNTEEVPLEFHRTHQGQQFLAIARKYNRPDHIPVITVTNQGTGLTPQMIANDTPTPKVRLYLKNLKLG